MLGDAGQINASTIVVGNLQILRTSLEAVGIGRQCITELEEDLAIDAASPAPQTAGKPAGETTMEWIKAAAKSVGGTGLKVGGAVAEKAIKRAVFSYLGM